MIYVIDEVGLKTSVNTETIQHLTEYDTDTKIRHCTFKHEEDARNSGGSVDEEKLQRDIDGIKLNKTYITFTSGQVMVVRNDQADIHDRVFRAQYKIQHGRSPTQSRSPRPKTHFP